MLFLKDVRPKVRNRQQGIVGLEHVVRHVETDSLVDEAAVGYTNVPVPYFELVLWAWRSNTKPPVRGQSHALGNGPSHSQRFGK